MKRIGVRKAWMVSGVAVAHVALVAGVVSLSQGCRTPSTQVEPPPAPVMPPPVVPSPAPLPPPALVPPPVESPAMPPADAKPPRELAPKEYVVQSGDSLSKIAARHGLSTRELAELNNLQDPNKIRVGQKLVLPGYAAPAPKRDKPSPTPKRTPSPGAGEYVVQKGDTLSGIAKKLGVKTADLRALNAIEGDKILEGQKLVVPAGVRPSETRAASVPAAPAAPAPEPPPLPVVEPVPMVPAPAEPPPVTLTPAPAAPPTPTLGAARQPIQYPVSKGETVDSIARVFMVSPEAIRKLNNLPDGTDVREGMRILIPVAP